MNGLDSIEVVHLGDASAGLTHNPYTAPDSESTAVASPALCCPKCQREFTLTWKRYVSSPMGHHDCPNCGFHGRVHMPVLSIVISNLIFLAILCVPFMLAEKLDGASGIIILGVVALSLFVFMDFDRHLDAKRPYRPAKQRKTVGDST